MTLTVVAEALAAAGREDRLRTALEAMIEPSLDEPGCLSFQLYADPNRPTRMVVVEEWTGEDALAAQMETAHYRHLGRVLADIVAEPVSIRRLVAAPGV